MADNQSIMIDIGGGLSLMTGLPAVKSWRSSGRPKNAKRGTIGFNKQTNKLEIYDGTNWYGAAMVKK